MKNYVLIFHVAAPFEDTDESNAAWSAWFETLGEHVVDDGNPFNPKAEAKVKGGEVTMGGDELAGYSIIKAESLDAAIEMTKGCPLSDAPDCWVSVHETMPM